MRCYYLTPFRSLFIVLALYFFGFSIVSGQSVDRPDDYVSIRGANKTVIFLDQFRDNSHQWVLSGDHHRAWISDGDMTLTSESSKVLVQWKDLQLPTDADLEIELRLRNAGGARSSMAGLTFGVDKESRRYVFWESIGGKFQISREDGSRRYDYQPLKDTERLQKYSYNSLVMRRVKNMWYFFINYELVSKMGAHEFYGNGVGLAVKGPIMIDVDFLKVSLLAPKDRKGPKIELFSHSIPSNNILEMNRSVLDLRGKVSDPSGMRSFKVNGRTTAITSDGRFSFASRLKSGQKVVLNLEAIDRIGNTSLQRIEVRRVEPKTSPVVKTASAPKPAAKPIKPTTASTAYVSQERGETYLLMIGVDKYKSWFDLNNAVKDCEDISRVLTREYDFDPANVVKIYNERATRSNILKELGRLQGKLKEHDNLVIYYAGHGHYDPISQLGYWVPVDGGHKDNTGLYEFPDYIPNSTIHDYLRAIKTKHTLLLADACYAGSLFTSYRGTLDANSPSRWAFTSGDLEKVWDGVPGQNSPFAAALISTLKRNQQSELRTDTLVEAVKTKIHRQGTEQSPVGNPLSRAGDEGGVFVFKRRPLK